MEPLVQLLGHFRHLRSELASASAGCGAVVVEIGHLPWILRHIEVLDEIHAIEVDIGEQLVARLILGVKCVPEV